MPASASWRVLGAPGGDEHVGPGADQGPGRLQPDAGVAAGDDGEAAGQVDAVETSAAVLLAPKPEPTGSCGVRVQVSRSDVGHAGRRRDRSTRSESPDAASHQPLRQGLPRSSVR